MIVVGPTGNRVRLPAAPGRTYPGYGIVVERSSFDAALQRAAIDAGAELVDGRADEPIDERRTPRRVLAVVVDPAARRHDHRCRRRDEPRRGGRGARGPAPRALGVRGPQLPSTSRWKSPTSCCGLRFGVRRSPATAGCSPPARDARTSVSGSECSPTGPPPDARRETWLRSSTTRGASACSVNPPRRAPPARALGAWLKMGLVGTTPARDRVLLVGDAAGLVNPLQGEGIAQAMDSGRAAAAAILGGIDRAAGAYRAHLARAHACLPVDGRVRAPLAPPQTEARRRVHSGPDGTWRSVGSLAGAWSITWNDLLDGRAAGPGHGRRHHRRRTRARPHRSERRPTLDPEPLPPRSARTTNAARAPVATRSIAIPAPRLRRVTARGPQGR